MAENDFDASHLDTLDRDLGRFSTLERATSYISRPLVAPGLSLVFILLAGLIAALFFGQSSNTMIVVIAAALGAYMALNIGANDVANNMGPAVGANALTMTGAIIIAAIFETLGALIAGGDVVDTISKGIVSPEAISGSGQFIWVMMAALAASAIWVNLATIIGAPVSTTHAIVGGVLGSGLVAAGFGAVSWGTMGSIAASWVISPVTGGLIASGLLWLIKSRIVYREDKIAAARVWVPILVGLMAGTFVAYLSLKGLSNLFDISVGVAVLLGIAFGIGTWIAMIPVVRKQSEGLENRNKSLKVLFSVPLIISAALMSFAHGANDVSNAIGPLAAIVDASREGGSAGGSVSVPLWVMIIGAFGLSFGLMLFGPKMIKMVGNNITKLNPMRAYCVALSAAFTVILASWLGMPVSSTHIAIGAIFGVGFFREWDAERRLKAASIDAKREPLSREERSRRKLVRRNHVFAIAAAWIVTVPAAGALSAIIFWIITLFV